MYYSIYSEDSDDSLARRQSVRAEHMLRIQALQDEGRVLLAGPHPAIDSNDPGPAGFSGSLVVAEFESLAAATKWAEDDPFEKAGVYVKVTVKPFKKIFPV